LIPIAKLRALLGCRLCWKITAGVFLLILAVESVILMPSARRFEQAETDRISQLARLAVEPALASPPATAAPRVLHDLARAVDQGHVAGVALFRRDGTVFARADNADRLQFPTELPEDTTGAPLMLSRDDRRLVVAWRSAAQESGVAVASLDARPVREALVAYVWRIAGLIAIIVGVVTAGTMLLLHLAVLRPLLRLRNSNREVSADPDAAEQHVIRTRRRDEVGELIEARNGMLTRIAAGIRRDRTHAAERERFLERHEPLTGLPNRAALLEHLDRQRALSGAGGRCVMLHLVNLLQFSLLNARIGKRDGDAVLQECARRLQRAAEPGDFIAHFSADRFALVRGGAACADQGVGLAERVLHDLGVPCDLGSGAAESIAVRVGIARQSASGLDAQALLSQAELALARAHGDDQASYQFFSTELANEVRERQSMTRDLEQAIGRGEVYAVFQPKMALHPEGAATLSGAESLLRWQHPTRGSVAPGVFIPLAESTGLIVALGDFVLRAACRQIREWRDRFGWSPPLAVNLAARQFALPDLEQRLKHVLSEFEIPPALLELEVTESAAMKDVVQTAATLRGLRSLGVRISIDDFGTGYSSLSYLRRFAVDAIKIDKSFVDEIGTDRGAEAICDAILRLGQALGTKVIAEGVEHARQLEFLRRRRCAEVQGYLFGKPLPAAEFAQRWLGIPARGAAAAEQDEAARALALTA